MNKATSNEAIVLLRIYRGSFNGKPRKGTDERDVAALIAKKLIEHGDHNDGAFYCTVLGNEVVSKILKVRSIQQHLMPWSRDWSLVKAAHVLTYGAWDEMEPPTNFELPMRAAFASAAMQGILSVPGAIDNGPPIVAKAAVGFANALIDELTRK